MMIRPWLFLFVLFLFLTSRSFAGTVTAVSKGKSLVKVDEGNPSGIKKGSKVCFLNEDNKRVGCGVVMKATESFSVVKVKSTKAMAVIKKGMTAKLVDGSGNEGTGEVIIASGGRDHRNNFKIGYVGAIMTPSIFNRISYSPPSKGSKEKQTSLWEKGPAASASLLGGYLEGEFAVGKSMAVSVGLRYRLFSDFQVQTNYGDDLSQYVDVSQEASAIGLYSDFTFLDVAFSESLFFRTSSGLDVDMSSVKFNATQKSDSGENNPIASYKSSLNLVSLRLGSHLSFMIGPLGLVTPGINLLVPMAAVGGKSSGTVSDPQADTILEGGSGAANEDLVKAIDHKKASFGAEVYLAAFLAF